MPTRNEKVAKQEHPPIKAVVSERVKNETSTKPPIPELLPAVSKSQPKPVPIAKPTEKPQTAEQSISSILSDMDTKIAAIPSSIQSKIAHSLSSPADHDEQKQSVLLSSVSKEASNFQMSLITAALDDCLTTFRNELHSDVQNLHLELLRQFEIQRLEMEYVIRESIKDGVRKGVEEVVEQIGKMSG